MALTTWNGSLVTSRSKSDLLDQILYLLFSLFIVYSFL